MLRAFLMMLACVSQSFAAEVIFEIPEGTSDYLQDWNSQDQPVRAQVGDTLIIVNKDTKPHRLHTDGRPCGHGDLIEPGESWSCVLAVPYNALEEKEPTRDHLNYDLKFWLIVTTQNNTDSQD